MIHRPTSWSVRIGAWAILLAPLVSIVSAPRRAWFDGRFAQLCMAWEEERAEKALLNDLGISAIFPSYRLSISKPDSFDADFGFIDKREFGLHGEDNASELYFNSVVYVTSDGRAMLPPFWRGSFVKTFGISAPSGAPLFAGIEVRDVDGTSVETDYSDIVEWRVWVWDENRWDCTIRVDLSTRRHVRFEFQPIRAQTRSIVCYARDTETETDALLASFEWDHILRRFTVSTVADPNLTLKDPLRAITLENPLFEVLKDEPREFDISEFDGPTSSASEP